MALVETAGAAWASGGSTDTVTTASFTPTANGLLAMLIGIGNANGITATGVTLTGTGFFSAVTWTQLTAVFGSDGCAAIYVLDVGASPSAGTVTVTMTPGTVYGPGLVITQFAGAAVAASQTGVTASVASGTFDSVSITPFTTGSQIVGAFGTYSSAAAVTANSGTSLYGQSEDTVNGSTFGAFESLALSVAGNQQVLGFTATRIGTSLVAAEILPSGTPGGPGLSTVGGSYQIFTG